MSLEIFPSIDLRHGSLVRLQQGDYARQTTYPLDPVETAKKHAESGATWLHVVDLDGAKEGRPVQAELIGKIARSTPLRVQAGGGVRGSDDIRTLLNAGAQRVVVGTYAIEHWDWFRDAAAADEFAGKLVLAIDAKDGQIATRGWTHTTGRKAVEVAAEVSDWTLAALLYTDVAVDGMLQGPNLEQTTLIARSTKVPVLASGGVGTIDHIRALKTTGAWGVIVGRSLYEGTLDLAEAVRTGR